MNGEVTLYVDTKGRSNSCDIKRMIAKPPKISEHKYERNIFYIYGINP